MSVFDYKYLSWMLNQNDGAMLTASGILYLSLGFKEYYTLQIIDLRVVDENQLHLILYDGMAYIGGKYINSNQIINPKSSTAERKTQHNHTIHRSPESRSFQQFDIVKVLAQFISSSEPIFIREIKLLKTNIAAILGKEVLTLEQFMNQKRFATNQVKHQRDYLMPTNQDKSSSKEIITQSEPYKKVKINEDALTQPIIILEATRPMLEATRPMLEATQPMATLQENKDSKKLGLDFVKRNDHSKIDLNERVNLQNEKISIEEGKGQQCLKMQQFSVNKLKGKQTPLEIEIQDDAPPQLQEVATQIKPIIKSTKFKEHDQINLQLKTIHEEVTNKQSKQPVQRMNKPCTHSISTSPPKNAKPNLQIPQLETHNTFISELYERIPRFKILCRVNYLTTFVSSKGTLCTKMMLIDEKGDEILAMLYKNQSQDNTYHPRHNKLSIQRGKCYTFENGEVVKDPSNGTFSINFSWEKIYERPQELKSFHESRMYKVSDIEEFEKAKVYEKHINLMMSSHSNQVVNKANKILSCLEKQFTICGIFHGVKEEPKITNNSYRVTGILDDPLSKKQINFHIFLSDIKDLPPEGSVIALHNIRIVTDLNDTIRLESSPRSYIINETNCRNQILAEEVKISENGSWRLLDYCNKSDVTYINRTIMDVANILSCMIEQQTAYSEIECNIMKIMQKKGYEACVNCRRETRKEEKNFLYCFSCKKIVKVYRRYIFKVTLVDSTSSFEVDIASQELSPIINLQVQEYCNLEKIDKDIFLEMFSYIAVVAKVKSQRVVGGTIHHVTTIAKSNPNRVLKIIKAKNIEQKHKLINLWD